MEFDIREDWPVTKIRFNDSQRVYMGREGLFVEGKCVAACIPPQDVENLIKALQKAVELGWTK